MELAWPARTKIVERRQFSTNYEKNRIRVCEIYGVDPDKASVHHIVGKAEVKRGRFCKNLFKGSEINQLSNLYPFEGQEGRRQHTKIHQKQDDMGVLYEGKRKTKSKKRRRFR